MTTFHDRIKVIDNFLPDEQIYKAYGTIDQMPSNWFLSKKSYINHEGVRTTSNDWWNIHGDRFSNPPLDPNGEITYQFSATEEHQEGCNCIYCETMEWMKANPPAEVGDHNILQHMLTVFKPGDYLSQHSDEEGTTWAFTLTLSAGWRPEWGGILHVQDPDDGEWYAFVPTFNRLILLDLTGPPLNHFVSKVTDDALQHRISLTGWYTGGDDVYAYPDMEGTSVQVLDHEPNPENKVQGEFTFTEIHQEEFVADTQPTSTTFGEDVTFGGEDHEQPDQEPDYPSVEDIDKANGFQLDKL